MNPVRARQIAMLQEFADRGDCVAELTVPAPEDVMPNAAFAITGPDGIFRRWTVISAVRHEWSGIGAVVTLGLYQPEGHPCTT